MKNNMKEFDLKIEYDLSEKELENLYSQADQIQNIKAFDTIIETIVRRGEEFVSRNSESWEETLAGRQYIRACELFRDEVRRLAGLYRDKTKPKEEFDDKEII